MSKLQSLRPSAAAFLLMMAMGACSFVGSPVWGMVYDGFGSYLPALVAVPVLILLALVCLLLVLREKKY